MKPFHGMTAPFQTTHDRDGLLLVPVTGMYTFWTQCDLSVFEVFQSVFETRYTRVCALFCVQP
jgi:hypothetical protein